MVKSSYITLSENEFQKNIYRMTQFMQMLQMENNIINYLQKHKSMHANNKL